MKLSEKIHHLVFIMMILALISIVGYFIYTRFIKTIPAEYRNRTVTYNGAIYKECLYEDTHEGYEGDKFLGNIKSNEHFIIGVFTVKNDYEGDYLILSGFLLQYFYVKEDIFEEHIAACHPPRDVGQAYSETSQ